MNKHHVTPRRAVKCVPGAQVWLKGQLYMISAVNSLESVRLVNCSTNAQIDASPLDLESSESGESADSWRVSDQEIRTALTRYSKLAKYVEQPCSGSDIEGLKLELGLGRAQIYSLIRSLRELPHPTALIRAPKGPRLGSTNLDDRVEAVIQKNIEAARKTNRQIFLSTIHDDVEADCVTASLRAPCARTIKKRIQASHAELLLRKKHGVT